MKRIILLSLFVCICISCKNNSNNKAQYTMKSNQLILKYNFSASPSQVFAAFSNPDKMRVWWTEDTNFDIDLKVDGKYAISYPVEGVTYTMSGEYIKVNPPHNLEFTCAMLDFSPDIDTISIELKPDDQGGTTMRFTQSGPGIEAELKQTPVNQASEREKGWKQGFDLIEDSFLKD